MMMGVISDKRGVLNVWISIIIACFAFSLFYALTYDIVCAWIFNMAIEFASPEVPGGFYTNIDRFRMLYDALPFVFIFSMIIYAFVQGQKKKYAPY